MGEGQNMLTLPHVSELLLIIKFCFTHCAYFKSIQQCVHVFKKTVI